MTAFSLVPHAQDTLRHEEVPLIPHEEIIGLKCKDLAVATSIHELITEITKRESCTWTWSTEMAEDKLACCPGVPWKGQRKLWRHRLLFLKTEASLSRN